MNSVKLFFLLVAISSFCWCILSCGTYGSFPTTFHGDKILRFHPQTNEQLEALVRRLPLIAVGGVDFWTKPAASNQPVDVKVTSKAMKTVQSFSKLLGLRMEVVCEDVQSLIDSSCELNTWNVNTSTEESFFQAYQRLDSIYSFMENLVKKWPSRTKIEVIGKSFEGREMKAIKISAPTKSNATKKIVWIDAGIHAREWIAPSTALFLIYQLITEYGNNVLVTASLDAFDFVILPSLNPDGYEYSHTKNRLWRKTRSTGHSSSCDGVDANRNFDWHWNEYFDQAGPLASPCAEDYPGPKAFSEKESQAVANYLTKNKGKVEVYLSLHSYSQLWMWPWGHTYQKAPRDAEHRAKATIAVDAIKRVSGRRYVSGPIYSTVYPVTGDSNDWAFGVAKIPWAFSVELPPRSGDIFGGGFILPASKIIPIGEETSAGILNMIKAIAEE